jgi:hypothetical protein
MEDTQRVARFVIFTARDRQKESLINLFQNLKKDRNRRVGCFRMNPETLDYILEKISPMLVKQSNSRSCITPVGKLVVTPRCYSCDLMFIGVLKIIIISFPTLLDICK